jgi:arsenite methyltransferase
MSTAVASADIRHAVRQKFNQVAADPRAGYRFRVGAVLARDVGYPPQLLSELPSTAAESFTGLAYLHPYLNLQHAASLLDLGCGAGLDAIIAARCLASSATVIGVDLAEEMVAKARHVAIEAGVRNAYFAVADAEALPFRTGAFDAAVVNGLFNLCPDKSRVARELSRILKPGADAAVAEITLSDQMSPAELKTADDWFR